jgi:hypothetical protein
MARRDAKARGSGPGQRKTSTVQQKRFGKPSVATSQLNERSQFARDRALHVLAAMRRDPKLSLSRTARLEGIKPETVKKYVSSSLTKSGGKFRATKSDRFSATLYLPDAHGKSVPIHTRSSKERTQVSRYLRDLGRYLRGDRNALAPWHGKKIGGVELVTAGVTLRAIEPALSDFSLYRSLGGDGV